MSDAQRKCAAQISEILGNVLLAEMDGAYEDAVPLVNAASIVEASDIIAALLTETRTKALGEALQAYPPLDGRKQYDNQWRLGYARLAYLWSTAIRAKAEEGEI